MKSDLISRIFVALREIQSNLLKNCMAKEKRWNKLSKYWKSNLYQPRDEYVGIRDRARRRLLPGFVTHTREFCKYKFIYCCSGWGSAKMKNTLQDRGTCIKFYLLSAGQRRRKKLSIWENFLLPFRFGRTIYMPSKPQNVHCILIYF